MFRKKSRLGISVLKNFLLEKIFKYITSKSTEMFLKGKDSISINPQLYGYHEKELTELIIHIADCGNNDFLIDIGANIGLISCQTGNSFQKVFCFEPNPLCFLILKANTEIMLDFKKTFLFNFGFGTKDEELTLIIPKHNWGGGFLKSKENSYNAFTLAKKDGFMSIEKENYLEKKVHIKNTINFFKGFFLEIGSNNKQKKGVIKIDVEGMEKVILEGISKALPENLFAYIIFENWDRSIDLQMIKKFFSNRKIEILKLNFDLPYKKEYSKLYKLIKLIFGKIEVKLENAEHLEDKTGDLIISIS